MLQTFCKSARRALSPGLIVTGALGASAYAAYQLEWLTVILHLHEHHPIHALMKLMRAVYRVCANVKYIITKI